MMERLRPALVVVLAFLSLLALAPSPAQAQAAPPALGSGATCYWASVWPAGSPKFPSGVPIKGCVSTDVETAATCWFGTISPGSPNILGGMSCTAYGGSVTSPYLCGTGGYGPPNFQCGSVPPAQCTFDYPSILPANDENCTTPCATGYRDGGGNCTTPPAKTKKKEPFSGDCDTCNASAGNDPENPTGPSKTQTGMSVASIFAMHVSQNISDIPVGYQPPKGPGAYIRLSYNQKDEGQPASFGYYNVGPKWTLNTLSFVTDDPATPGKNLMRNVPYGGHVDYKYVPLPYNGTTGAFPTERSSKGTLYRIPATGAATSYELRFASGTKHVYGLFDGATVAPRRVFLTRIVDPQGNAVTLNYDASLRLTSLTDATGRATTFGYTNADPKKVTRITDPFGRHADLSYDGSGRLAAITDTIGIVSSFGYSAAYGGYINALTTPYGTTGFNYYETAPSYLPTALDYQSMEQTDPLGNTRRVVFRDQSSLAATPAPKPTGVTVTGDYSRNNSFIWDEHAYPLAIVKDAGGNVTAEDTTKAHLMHWLKNSLGAVASVRAAVKAPLENLVFFNYPGQANAGATGTFATPTAAGRVLDDATSSVTKATYNPLGKPLTMTDAKGRVTTYTYAANNIDLLTVKQGANLIATFANYTAQHKPQSYTDAAGKLWNYAYNAAGQTIYTTDPLNETRFWEYDSLGRVIRTTVPTVVPFASVVYGTTNASVPTATSYTYDAYDRVRTRTDSAGYALTYDYDALDHVTKITYPDGSHDDYDYTFQSGPNAGQPSLDVRKFTDRLGRITTYTYDANRRLTSVTEPLTNLPATTRTTSYSYYANGALKDQTDASGNVTHYAIDIQGRPTSKTYAYGTAGAKTETTAYENTTSRQKSLTDALNQVKTYSYALDNRITGIAYTNAVNPTPNVTIAYDTVFPRRTSITDGTGTTSFTYIAAGTNGALQLASLDNASFVGDTDKITNTYDALGRLSTRTISGGNESFTYDTLGRTQTHATGLGTFTYGYLGQTPQVTSRTLNGTSIGTSWAYDSNTADRRLTTITNSGVARSYGLSYIIPGAGGASSPYDIYGITDTAAATHPWASQTHDYSYDQADRLLTASQPIPGNNAYAYDKLDNATTVTIPGSGTVNPTYNAMNQLATSGAKTYAYDANGNTLSGDGAKTYKWDAENRLKEINYVSTGNKTVFTYDAFGHRILTAETVGGTTTTTRNLWCGDKVCQTRTSTDVVTRRHFDEGEHNIATGQKLIYMQDQLGSVRDVRDATTGALVASYDYSPYGNITRSWGAANTDYRYARLFYHQNSGLNLATYRGYDSATGRFINRDPIRESGGINIYAYVGGNPVSRTDLRGESWPIVFAGIITTIGWFEYMVDLTDFSQLPPSPHPYPKDDPGACTERNPRGFDVDVPLLRTYTWPSDNRWIAPGGDVEGFPDSPKIPPRQFKHYYPSPNPTLPIKGR